MTQRTPKQKLLNTLSHADLRRLVDRLHLGGEIRKTQPKDGLLRDLSRLKRVTVEEIVASLRRDGLRTACRELGLDESGSERQLARQIMARFGRSGRPLPRIHAGDAVHAHP